MNVLFKNIKSLIQVREAGVKYLSGEEMSVLPTIEDAYLVVEDGKIDSFGKMESCPEDYKGDVVDATGKMILPAWCDSHTHLVYAGHREGEFIDRINGLSYEEIAQRGGGIVNSALRLADTSEEDLYQQSKVRLEQVIKMGTGSIEIKSGYGLTLEGELKMLRVIKRLEEEFLIPIKATFLGAHALPVNYKNDKAGYVKMLIEVMVPAVAKQGVAEYIDVFCEEGYFSTDDTAAILETGLQYGLVPKIHVNQFNAIGGVKVGVDYNARSVDHLEEMRQEDIQVLKGGQTMPVALPGCSHFLSIPYTPARQMIDAGLPLALASDYNPGSAPSGNMNFIVSTACVKMKMTPEEAINAATINGAYAMGLEEEVGSVTIGKRANLILTSKIPSYGFLPYSFGENHIDKVFINGIEQ